MSAKETIGDVQRLQARIEALEKLLQVHEQAAITQAEQLERTVCELRERADDLQRSEKVLRESEERFCLAMEAGNLGTWDWDILSDRVTCSEHLKLLFGLPPDLHELTYGAFLNAIHAEDRARAAAAINRSITTGTDCSVEFRTVWQDDSARWIAMKAKVYRGSSGLPVRMVAVAMDMTERRRSEEAIRESEARYRLLFESNPNPMWVYDLESLAFLAVNQAAVAHYGYSQKEFLAMTIKDIRPPEHILALMEKVSEVKSGFESAGVWRHRKKDGAIIDVDILAHTLTFGDRPAQLVLARDITDQKRAEEALRNSEERFISFMDNLPGFAWIKDAQGRYVYTNRYFRAVFGMCAQSWEGKTDHDVFPPDIADRFVANDRKVIESGKEIRTTEEFVLRDGRHIGLVSKFPISRPGDRLLVGGISIDVTEQMHTEEALRLSEDRFQVFMNNSPAVAFMKDEDGRHLYVNEPFARMFGKPVAEWLGKTDQDIWPPDVAAQLREHDLTVLAGDKVVELEEAIPTPDGTWHQFLVFKFPFREASGKKVLAGIAIEVTDRKYLEEQLRQAQKMEAIGRLAGGVAHDFNNLLTVISGYSELLQHHLRHDETLRKQVEQIKLAGDRGSALTRQLLAFSRQQVLRPEVLDLNRAVSDLLQMLQRLIGEHIVLNTVLSGDPTFVRTDAGQLEQVLLNLVINARDAMPDGGALTIETANVVLDEAACHRLGIGVPGQYVRLTAQDTGCGMDTVTQTRVFEPFFTTKDQGKGTGLGLATVYGIVIQSHGAISVDSAPGRGTTFTIYLPRSEASSLTPDRPKEYLPPAMGSETVLVVEDQQGVRGFVRNLLRLNGYQVLEASDGEEALRVCREHDGDIRLLLTDLVMPGMSGRELAEKVVAQRPQMRVLFMSGYTDDSVVHAGVAASGMAFLQKPFSPTVLTRKIREALDAP